MTLCGYCLRPMDEHATYFDCADVQWSRNGVTLWLVTPAFMARATFPC